MAIKKGRFVFEAAFFVKRYRLTNATFKTDGQQLLCFNGKLHG